MIVNLISDTVTTPSDGMLDAMFNATVGDDVFKEDPSVNIFENQVASLFGKEAALFFPSGTMTNQTAIKLHTQPGDQLICDHYAHIFNYEGGGVSFNSGVSCKMIQGERGKITSEQIKSCINSPDFYHSPRTSLVCLENTTNKGGGHCWDVNQFVKIKKICDENELGLHMDGARVWNSIVAKNNNPELYGNYFDTISVCLSKGLGCPVGSILVGKKKFIDKALRIRKILGGGMRQVGYLAAAGLYALENNLQRLSVDHQKAKEIASRFSSKDCINSVNEVETNIIILELNDSVEKQKIINHFSEKEIIFDWYSMGLKKIRIVTHLNYSDEDHKRLLQVVDNL